MDDLIDALNGSPEEFLEAVETALENGYPLTDITAVINDYNRSNQK